MSTPPIQENLMIQLSGDDALAGFRTRRRKLLGVVLIIIGSVWLGLSLSGAWDESAMPIDWIVAMTPTVARIPAELLLLSIALVACGMLATSSIRRTR